MNADGQPSPDDRARALRLTPVSRETEARLDLFVELVLAWQAKTNLIAPSTIPHLWTRHVADSLQLLPLAPAARHWVDLGSGGGFPGIVLACALAETPGATLRLIESNARKAAFLREAARALDIPALVHCARIEDFVAQAPEQADALTARALAPLDRLLPLVYPLLRKSACALLPKGREVETELTEAAKNWSITFDSVQSKTSRDGRILIIRGLKPRR